MKGLWHLAVAGCVFACAGVAAAASATEVAVVRSPDGKTVVTLQVDERGHPSYTVRREGVEVMPEARLGMRFGLAIPITETGGNAGFVSVCGPSPCADARCRSALTLVSIYVYHRLRALALNRIAT